ncbi:LysR family transcriptional regulator [Bacillus sp. NP157]|nr:LysR family transcriptional regulator [Bacillus sp. NP157]
MIRLDDIGLFIAVAVSGSFSAAARTEGLLPAQASVAIKRLEAALGVDLFIRNTRHVRLSRKGELYLPLARNMLSAVRLGRDSVRTQAQDFEGDLAIGVAAGVGRAFLAPWLATFHRRHPRLRVRLCVGAGEMARADALLRYGTRVDASVACDVIASHSERVLVASPGYLSAYGDPASLEDLARHACITATADSTETWQFTTGRGRVGLPVRGAWCTDDGDLVRRWAMQGHGIAFRPLLEVSDDLCAGKLIRVLPNVAGDALPLILAHLKGNGSAGVVRALAAWLRRAAEAGQCTPTAVA